MNKNALLLIITIILIVGVLLAGLLFINSNRNVGEFKLSDYQRYLDNYSSDKVTIEIKNAKIAREQSEKIWIEMFGVSIKNKKPYKVFYDKVNKVWLIQGSIPENWDGGIPYILIKTDGKVLAVWHSK
jgi:hypothetical protein